MGRGNIDFAKAQGTCAYVGNYKSLLKVTLNVP